MKRKILHLLLAAAILCLAAPGLLAPATAFGADACDHTHDLLCGYSQGTACDHSCTELPCGGSGDCAHEHSPLACGYEAPTACGHMHDAQCGGTMPLAQNGPMGILNADAALVADYINSDFGGFGLSALAEGSVVTVSGSSTAGTQVPTMHLNIPAGVQVVWTAQYDVQHEDSGTAPVYRHIVLLTGAGDFEMNGGSIICKGKSSTAYPAFTYDNDNVALQLGELTGVAFTGNVRIQNSVLKADNSAVSIDNASGTLTVDGADTVIASAYTNMFGGAHSTLRNYSSASVYIKDGMITNIMPNGGRGAVDNGGLQNAVTHISGGTVKGLSTASYLMGTGLMNSGNGKTYISGGSFSADRDYALYNTSTEGIEIKDAQISGGTVGNNNFAIWQLGTGTIKISGDAQVTSTSARGTIRIHQDGGTQDFTGHTVVEIDGDAQITNTGDNASAHAIFNNSGGTVSVKGGSVSSTAGSAIYNNTAVNNVNKPGQVLISGGTLSSADGHAVANVATGGVTIASATLSSGTSYSIWNINATQGQSAGTITMTAAPQINGTVRSQNAILTTGTLAPANIINLEIATAPDVPMDVVIPHDMIRHFSHVNIAGFTIGIRQNDLNLEVYPIEYVLADDSTQLEDIPLPNGWTWKRPSDSIEYEGNILVIDGEEFDVRMWGVPYGITLSAEPDAGGTMLGSGQYEGGDTRTIEALPNDGYSFVEWTKDGVVVSTDPSYTFTLTEDSHFVAHFYLRKLIGGVPSEPGSGPVPNLPGLPPPGTGAITGLPGSCTLTNGQSVSWLPLPSGGVWSYDSEYLSMSRDGGRYSFTAKKTGHTTATYTVNGMTHCVYITIVSFSMPPTNDLSNPLFPALFMLLSIAGISIASRRKRNG